MAYDCGLQREKTWQEKDLEEQIEMLTNKNKDKCKCKQSTFTRIVTDDFEPQCGKCGRPI